MSQEVIGLVLATIAVLALFGLNVWAQIDRVQERDRWMKLIDVQSKRPNVELLEAQRAWNSERHQLLKDAGEDRAALLNRIMAHDYTEYATMRKIEQTGTLEPVLRSALTDQEEFELEQRRTTANGNS